MVKIVNLLSFERYLALCYNFIEELAGT